jgi:hypothetical protein
MDFYGVYIESVSHRFKTRRFRRVGDFTFLEIPSSPSPALNCGHGGRRSPYMQISWMTAAVRFCLFTEGPSKWGSHSSCETWIHNSTVPERIPHRGRRTVTVGEAITIVIAAHVQHRSHSTSLDAHERQQAHLSTVGSPEGVLAVENLTA